MHRIAATGKAWEAGAAIADVPREWAGAHPGWIARRCNGKNDMEWRTGVKREERRDPSGVIHCGDPANAGPPPCARDTSRGRSYTVTTTYRAMTLAMMPVPIAAST